MDALAAYLYVVRKYRNPENMEIAYLIAESNCFLLTTIRTVVPWRPLLNGFPSSPKNNHGCRCYRLNLPSTNLPMTGTGRCASLDAVMIPSSIRMKGTSEMR